jgi:chromosomal replication initiator protein
MSLLTTPSAWSSVLGCIRKRISPQQYATWFQNLQAHSGSEEDIRIRVPNRFFREWLSENYLPTIRASVEEALGCAPEIHFVIDDTITPSERDEADAPRAPTAAEAMLAPAPPTRPSGMLLNDQYTFDTFVVGPSNQLSHAAAVAVSEKPGTTYNPLFMYGSVGLGKSHLLQAVCHAILAKNPRARVAYLSCETFVNEFISAIQRNNLPSFRDRHRQLDLLLIDDIQFLSRAERSQEEFFHTFNDLYNARKQIVLTSDQPPQEINGLQDRLISRFKSGLISRIEPPSYEMRVAILKKKSELRNVDIPNDVIDYIATVVSTNILELDGAVTKVVGYASLLNQAITVDVARTALHEPTGAKPQISIEEILKVVTKHYAVRVSDLQSKKRTRSIVLPRQVSMYLARALTMMSLEEIGGYFGGRDHSTVLHAEEKIRTEIQRDPGVAGTIEKLKRDLNAPTGDRSLT